MSTVTSTVTSCPSLQGMLNEYFETCSFTSFGSPFLDFLNSDINRSGIRQLVNPEVNKKRTVQLVYDQPIWVDEATAIADCDKQCTATTERGDLYANYTIDCTDGLYMEELIKTSSWIDSCRNNQSVIASHIMKLVFGLEDAIAQKTAQELPPLVGAYSSDVPASGLTVDADDFLNVATQQASSTNIDPQAFQQIDLALTQTGYCNGRFVTGGSDLFQYYRYLQAGCCADQGLDALEMLRLYGNAVTWDRWVAAEFGNDVSIVAQPGSLQLLTLNKAEGNVFGDIDIMGLGGVSGHMNYWEGIIISPRSGLPMDIRISDACGSISIFVELTTKLVGLPLDIYPVGHPLEGVTYVNGIQVVNS